MSINAGLVQDIINFVLTCVVFAVVTYFIAYFMIGKFQMATPGRLGNYTDEEPQEAGGTGSADLDTGHVAAVSPQNQLATDIIKTLGGKQNIVEVDACMTRLRVTVKDTDAVGDEKTWKELGALGLIKVDNGVQAVYGPKADVLKSDIQDIFNR
ncbi:UNVERIFIED_CONTAM: glucose-like phosphotransferase system IIB component [Paenibacillus sp. PvR008]